MFDIKMESDSINELTDALAKAQGTMKSAVKNSNNPFFKSKYADLQAIVEASQPHLSENGLCIYHVTRINEAGDVILITTLAHKSGQFTRADYPIKPLKNDPQGMGSAMTYARRYSYAAIAGIAVSDATDDDGHVASNCINTHQNEMQDVKALRGRASEAAHAGEFGAFFKALPEKEQSLLKGDYIKFKEISAAKRTADVDRFTDVQGAERRAIN